MKDQIFGEIARLEILAKTNYLPAVTGFVREIASSFELKDPRRLELLVEEAALNVIDLSFGPQERGVFELIITRKPGQVIVEVTDKGLPVDYSRLGDEEGLGVLLLKRLADEVNFINRGKAGKAVEIILNLEFEHPEGLESVERIPESAQLAPTDEELNYRYARAEDTFGITRSIYRTYGYSYLSDTMYFPEKIKELIEQKYLVSVVAANPIGEIVGHASIRFDFPGAIVGEFGQLVADPRYRGRGIASNLNDMLVDYALKNGMFGYYADAVTTHPFSQKTILKSGAFETAYMPGFVPESLEIKSMAVDNPAERRAEIAYFRRIGLNRRPTIFPPVQHTSMIEKIYKLNALDYEIAPSRQISPQIPPMTTAKTRVFETPGRAFIAVSEFGEDFEAMLAHQFKQLCIKKISTIILDLPLDCPWTRKKTAVAEKMGFFFCGVMPGLSECGSDLLRLIYLNNVDVEADKPVIVTDFAKELAAYVLGQISN